MTSPELHDRFAGLLTGYFGSQLVHVAARLRLADLLSEGARSANELAEATGTHPVSLYRLLRALAAIGVFVEEEEPGGRFALNPLGSLLRGNAPNSQRAAALLMGSEFYHAWGHLLASIRTGHPVFPTLYQQPYFDYLAEHPESARVFDDAMTSLNDRKTLAMLDTDRLQDVDELVDLGGGNGGTLVQILRRFPAMRGVLFDRPGVIERAVPEIDRAGADIAARCRAISGSFLTSGEVPTGADAYLLRHILHNWDDEHALVILRNLRPALKPTARVLVVERLIPDSGQRGIGPVGSAASATLMDLTMLVIHGGAERTKPEFERLFEAAGLRLDRIVPLADAAGVNIIEARPLPAERSKTPTPTTTTARTTRRGDDPVMSPDPIADIAQRHGFSVDAARTLYQSLQYTGGGLAQFSHPELGGTGQWMPGMIMIGDMFNNSLKYRVSGLCSDLAALVASGGGPGAVSTGGAAEYTPLRSMEPWWPRDLGQPNSSGSQNDLRYAYFAGPRRLAVSRGGVVTIYDTGDHSIGGVSQQQGGSYGDVTFSSQLGQVSLHQLKIVGP